MKYSLIVTSITGGGPFVVMSVPITNGGDWAWTVSVTVQSSTQTKVFIADPQMEVGDLGSPG